MFNDRPVYTGVSVVLSDENVRYFCYCHRLINKNAFTTTVRCIRPHKQLESNKSVGIDRIAGTHIGVNVGINVGVYVVAKLIRIAFDSL